MSDLMGARNGGNVILVTGVSGYWGMEVARRLIAGATRQAEAQRSIHVIGLDADLPEDEIEGLDFIQADIRNPLMVDLLRSENVRTVCHLAFVESTRPAEATFDANVIGTMKLMGACVEAGVRKVVMKSSTAVYGARPENPAFLTEDHPLEGSRRYGTTRDLVEIETFCNGLKRQAPGLIITILRFASIVGPEALTPMTRFLREPWTPVLLGFDPLMQVIHERDVIDALVSCIVDDVPGVFNVAAEGVLPLTKLMAIAGKFPVPLLHPLAYLGAGLLGYTGSRVNQFAPIELDYIRYPWVADLRKMQEELGFTPRYTAEEALREFAGQQRLRRIMPEAIHMAYDEERLRDTLERRQRERQRAAERANPEAGSASEAPDNA